MTVPHSFSTKLLVISGVCGLIVGMGLGTGVISPESADINPIEQASESIVSIGTETSSGSGVVVSADGVIATSLHVVAGSGDLFVEMPDGQRYNRVDVVDFDVDRDLAVLKIVADKLPSVSLAETKAVPRGTSVFAIANPEGLVGSVSAGVLSATRVEDDGIQYLQTDAAISPGSSGGGLFLSDGSLIGILTSSNIFGQNLNFALPIDSLRPLLGKEVKYSEEAFRALDPSLFVSSVDTPTSDGMAKLMDMLDRYDQFYDDVVYTVVEPALGVFSAGIMWDVEFYRDLALMCMPLDAKGSIPAKHHRYMLETSTDIDFGYLTLHGEVANICYEIPLRGLTIDAFASIFRAAINDVSLLREDTQLGQYVPEPISLDTLDPDTQSPTDDDAHR